VDPQRQFCPNEACAARGQVGQGNIRVHCWLQHRYRCVTCGRTFAATAGTPFYRAQTAAEQITLVLTLLVHGCPLQAIVAAFGFDERTVARWRGGAVAGGGGGTLPTGAGPSRAAGHPRPGPRAG
jgi:transposase-like protein